MYGQGEQQQNWLKRTLPADTVKYWKSLLELILLLLAIPWILKSWLRSPSGAVHDPALSSLG